MSEFLKNNNEASGSEAANSGNGARTSDKRGARPLGNRFPKDPALVAAIKKQEKEWQAVLASLSMTFGISTNNISNTLGR